MISFKRSDSRALSIAIFLIFFGILLEFYSFSKAKELKNLGSEQHPNFIIVEENSLSSLSNPEGPPPKTLRKMNVIITAYSSTRAKTDDTPYITASGSRVRDGIVANNYLPFGTKIRIPELYKDKVFVVEDRMSWKKSNSHIDIWFPDYHQALLFGTKRTYIEILER